MKKSFTILCTLLFFSSIMAQQASDYFPTQTGYEWKFKAIPLDSVSNPINALAFYRMDKFESVTNYEGKLANIVLTKSGPLATIQLLPFLDSLFYSTENTNGFEFFSIRNIEPFLISLDSTGLTGNFSFLDFFTSLQSWYSTYRFASNVNAEYTLVQVDTSITISGMGYNFRFRYVGKRLTDQTIPTVLGNYDCKKFLLQWKIAYLLGPIPIELLSTKDTIWIAQNNWIVQDIIPGQYINNLTFLGIPPFSIPGLDTKLTDEIVVSVDDKKSFPLDFSLEQNYPNPFNPSTTIRYSIPSSEFITLKVFDVLGNEVATLVNEEKPAGNYEVEFSVGRDSSPEIVSGIYFYKLQVGNVIGTKKMILMK